jgi:hypothetical protein
MSETRSSKKAAEPTNDQFDKDVTEEALQIMKEEYPPVKVAVKPPNIKTELSTMELSAAEMALGQEIIKAGIIRVWFRSKLN